MNSEEGWTQRGMEAMRSTFHVDAATKRDMIQFLLDEGFWNAQSLTWDSAVARFNDCLNPGKAAFFKLAEVWALMRRFERHDLFNAMAEDLGYRTHRIPTEERRHAVMDRLASAVEACEAALNEARSDLADMRRRDMTSEDTPRRPAYVGAVHGAGGF